MKESVIKKLKDDINEVNLLNSKLLYTTKLFKAKALTESHKVKIVEAFDRATTPKESKLIYETFLTKMQKSQKKAKNSIKENLGLASKVIGGPKQTQNHPIVDPQIARWQKLAGIN